MASSHFTKGNQRLSSPGSSIETVAGSPPGSADAEVNSHSGYGSRRKYW